MPMTGGRECRRADELVGVVRLDERVEPQLLGEARQPAHLVVAQVAEEEQDRVRARLPGDAQMLVGREKSFRQERDARRGAGGAEVVPVAAEALVDEHGDGRGTGLCVCGRDRSGIGVRADITEGRRAALDLGDRAEPGCGQGVSKPHC